MSVIIKFELPKITTYKNAVAMPSRKVPVKVDPLEMHGGIFDDNGNLIGSSGLYRGDDTPIMAGGILQIDNNLTIEGNVAYGGFLYRHHYGHFLIESLSRMWALMRKDEYDGIYFHAHPGVNGPCAIGEYILGKLGWEKNQIHIINQPLRFSKISIPDVSLRLGSTEGYAVHKQVCSAIADKVCGDFFRPLTDGVRPIYFSRTKFTIRPIFGEHELEAELTKQGWEIVYPEELSVEQQIKISRKSNVYCGVIGSAMHNLMFSRSNTKVFYIEREPRHRTTYNTLEVIDKIIDLSPTYIKANVKSASFAGPFLINPNVVLAELNKQGLIGEYEEIDLTSAAGKYEQFVKNIN